VLAVDDEAEHFDVLDDLRERPRSLHPSRELSRGCAQGCPDHRRRGRELAVRRPWRALEADVLLRDVSARRNVCRLHERQNVRVSVRDICAREEEGDSFDVPSLA